MVKGGREMTRERLLEEANCQECEHYTYSSATWWDPPEHVCSKCDFGDDGLCDKLVSLLEKHCPRQMLVADPQEVWAAL